MSVDGLTLAVAYMIFNSIHYFVFFPVVAFLFFALPSRLRLPFLLLASCYFYMAFVPRFILILFFLIAVDFSAGIVIERSRGIARKAALVLSLVANLATLFVFKYYDFFATSFNSLLEALGFGHSLSLLKVMLPIGLSFHTFQSMAYVIEVYFGRQKAERNPGVYALYVLFFPQMVAGPIERPQRLLPQLSDMRRRFDPSEATEGLRYVLWGLFKKIFIADRLGIIADQVYGHPRDHGASALVAGTLAFAIQIYADFSGYSDIAIGSARILGFRLSRNFLAPYHATSLSDFWRRWHLSLSTWFRDYVYIPLGGNRGGNLLKARNVMIAFALSGLWHGANWTYLVWGLLNGAFLVVESALPRGDRLPRFTRKLIVFFLINLTWIFFRSNEIGDALYILSRLVRGPYELHSLALLMERTGGSFVQWLACAYAFALVWVLEPLEETTRVLPFFQSLPRPARWVAYTLLALSFLDFGPCVEKSFVYFQF